MNILIWGFGNTCRNLLLEIEKDVLLDKIISIVDSDKTKWGNICSNGIKIDSPENIINYEFDYIVIASIYEKEIFRKICTLGYKDKTLTLSEYLRNRHARGAYFQRYKFEDTRSQNIFDTRIVVYTAITGDYDGLNDPEYYDSNIDYVCFTNNRNIKSSKWNINYIDDSDLDNMYLAKKIKMFPNMFFPEYNTSIWVDGKFKVIGNLTEYVKQYQKTQPILCFPHFKRDCIYDEAATCIENGIGKKIEILQEITDYFLNSYPLGNGLYEMGCIVRNHHDKHVCKLMSDWWNEIIKYSNRDQISFPYVCWKNDFLPDICDLDLYKNQWLRCTRNYSKDIGK